MSPVFSVVIQLFNKAGLVKKSIESVLSQTFQVFEIIVVDDGSTDNSAYVVKEFRDSLIRVISQSNGGVSFARNVGLKESRGDIITFLDADDLWLPFFLQKILNNRTNVISIEKNFLITA